MSANCILDAYECRLYTRCFTHTVAGLFCHSHFVAEKRKGLTNVPKISRPEGSRLRSRSNYLALSPGRLHACHPAVFCPGGFKTPVEERGQGSLPGGGGTWNGSPGRGRVLVRQSGSQRGRTFWAVGTAAIAWTRGAGMWG